MSQIMKAFTGVFMILFMMTAATGILGAFLQVSHAQNAHATVIHELENSNYAIQVMEQCFEFCDNWGYDLNLALYIKSGGIVQCHNRGELSRISNEISSARVHLKFPVEIGFLGVNLEQEISGYGR